MHSEDLRELLVLIINRNQDLLSASAIESEGARNIIAIEDTHDGSQFFLEIEDV